MTDTWWPEGYDYPAFRLKRQTYGLTEGGDWVRGSSVETLEHTALRYPTRSLDPTVFEAAARGQLFVKAFDYHTVEVEWNWPKSLEDIFQEVAIVRSTFGAPAAPLQGQTIFRALRSDLPTFKDANDVVHLNPPPLIYDQPLPPGHWYYYTAFFRTNPIDWTPIMSDACLIPRDYGHSNHLWNTIPPYYQWTDDNYRVGSGFLRNFLTIFGFEMDRTREYVESLLDLHWIDRSPMMLLKQLGANYGYPYEQGLGDVRYRALLSNISHLLSVRGTAKGMLELVETVSKYDCDLTQGPNSVLLPDDSNFMTSTGHWAPMHPSTNLTPPLKADYLAFNLVKLTANPVNNPFPPTAAPGSTGTMLVDSADNTGKDMFITLGSGKIDQPDPAPDTELVPYYSALPVNAEEVYGFDLYVKMAKPSPVLLYMIPFTSKGQITDALPAIAGSPVTPPNTNWFLVPPMYAQVPATAHYFVPAVYFDNRQSGGVGGRSPRIDIAAVMMWKVQQDVPATITAPDRYLTLGDPAEKLGATKAGYEGYIIGSPAKGS